ncbi:hypothetical protein O181_058349 [Austropuccinia psidii MF-1]|uniref:Uncharacterized protein n=1 Tax=Austropuccinia psidii MF-1 TaxID=1389203 RepID=A0A9Q3HXJ9_9BASI|nr:hypothetical protein [Austropuccinia psidii MF-1]
MFQLEVKRAAETDSGGKTLFDYPFGLIHELLKTRMNPSPYSYDPSDFGYNNFFPQSSHENGVENLRKTISAKDEIIEKLMKKVEGLEVKFASQKEPKSKVSQQEKRKSSKKGKNQADSKKAQKGNKVSPSPKRSPYQMLTSEVPEDFHFTKEALFIHIKVLWGMLEKQCVPPSPDHTLLKEFFERFSNHDQVQNAENSNNAASLIQQNDVQTLRDARAGRRKIGKYIVNLEDFYFHYIRELLSKLGIGIWAPDLEDAPGSLYNESCRTVALMTFRQVACSGAYQYMRANLTYLNNLELLQKAYNHFVHFLMAQKYKKEIQESGSNEREAKRRVIQRRRQRLCRKRYTFSVSNNYPTRYLKVLAAVDAHSDDELNHRFNVYSVRKLAYRSDSADIFFQNLDRKMHQSKSLGGKNDETKPRCRPKVPIPSTMTKVPKLMALDFYPPEWFNKLDYSERFNIADTKKVAFIPTSDFQMSQQVNSDEFLGDRTFNQKYWDIVTQPYDLSHEIAKSSDEDEDSEESQMNEFSDGDVIDMQESNDDSMEDADSANADKQTDHSGFLPDVDQEMADVFEVGPSNGNPLFAGEEFTSAFWE